MIKPRLISFKVCPFVQRNVILLKEKDIDFDIVHIDLSNPPDWFLNLSPTKKVPVLEVEEGILFESAIINEYLNEKHSLTLHPSDVFSRAKNRAWIEFMSPLYMSLFGYMMSKSESDAKSIQLTINNSLDILDKEKIQTPWFNGENISILDISIAPLFVYLDFVKRNFSKDLLEEKSNLELWSSQLLQRQSVIDSVVHDLDDLFIEKMKSAKSFLIK
jgi:glutathione S-transferase